MDEDGEIPPDLIPPVLSLANQDSWDLFCKVKGMKRYTPSGTVEGMDLGAISTYFNNIGIENVDREIDKMQLIAEELFQGKEK